MTFDGGRYDEALEQYRKTIEISPNFYATYEAMSWAFRHQGKFVEAIQSLRGAIPGFVNDSNDDRAIASAIDDLQPAYARRKRGNPLPSPVALHKVPWDGNDHAQVTRVSIDRLNAWVADPPL